MYLKPLRDKGCYGWLYRVYPEPWQVIYELPGTDGEYVVVGSFEARPDFREATAMMLREAARRASQAPAA